jgi:hypothetical protein
MTGGTSEAIVEIEVAERGIQVIAPHQAHDPPAQPNAFRMAGRAAQNLGSLGEFVELSLAIFLGFGVAIGGWRLGSLGIRVLG